MKISWTRFSFFVVRFGGDADQGFRSQLEKQLCSSLAASALKPAEHHGVAS